MNTMLITNISKLYGIENQNNSFRKGNFMAQIDLIENAFVYIKDGLIRDFGKMEDCNVSNSNIIKADDKLVLPGFCDSHTHLIFAATREDEFVMRIKGKTYEEIAASGGGILNSAKKMQAIDEELLYEKSHERLKQAIKCGTTTIEIKSGYGLTLESELKMLRVANRLKQNFPIPIKTTFLGAHAIPMEYKDDRDTYINILIHEMLPQVAEQKLADFCDVFCDKGFFTIEETDKILIAATNLGLKAKIHANELANSGGVQVGIKHNAVSVDHLEEIGLEEINALSQTSTIPTVLPSCSYFLGIPYAPARKMVDAGLGVCIATDFNPGTSPSYNMGLLMSIACTQMKLTPTEVLNAMTMNGACALELQSQVGSIAIGKEANLILTKPMNSIDYIPYYFGESFIDKVIVRGQEF